MRSVRLAGLDTGCARTKALSKGLFAFPADDTGPTHYERALSGQRVLPRRSLTPVIVALALLVAGCGGKAPPVVQPTIVEVVKTVEVKVPVPVKAEPPPELLAPFKIPLPVFVAPSDADTSSALTVEGERFLRGLIEELLGRLEAWKKWAEAK